MFRKYKNLITSPKDRDRLIDWCIDKEHCACHNSAHINHTHGPCGEWIKENGMTNLIISEKYITVVSGRLENINKHEAELYRIHEKTLECWKQITDIHFIGDNVPKASIEKFKKNLIELANNQEKLVLEIEELIKTIEDHRGHQL